MSRAKKFEVGDRVHVVNADPISGDVTFVGKYGSVTSNADLGGYDYIVHIDGDTAYAFVESELAKVEAKIIEGVVLLSYEETWIGDTLIGEVIETGDEVRITIETIRKAGGR